MKPRGRSGTIIQQVFDAIVQAGGELSLRDIAIATGLRESSVRFAIADLKRSIPVDTCKQPTIYRIAPNTERPKDRRGRHAA